MEIGEDDHLLDAELLPIMLDQRERNTKRPPMLTVTIEQMRERASKEFEPWNANPPYVESVKNYSIDAETHKIPVRLYDPNPNQKSGILAYFHGGGWIIGDLELEDAVLRTLAIDAGIKILSVDYRLSPENRFPAAIEDGEAIMQYLINNANELNIDLNRISFGGGSAGANVALGSVLRIRDAGKKGPDHLTLLYGVFSRTGDAPSYEKYGNGRFGLPKIAMDYFWREYMGEQPSHPHAAPLEGDLSGLPSAFILECELDVLADDSKALAQRLATKGIRVNHKSYKGAMHGFTQYFKSCALARAALKDIADELRSELAL